jgi:steroid delta-isomerase-like uncharacterized protein
MTIPEQRVTSPLEAVQAYLAAWNAHDGAAVARIVTGTYVDPTLPAPIRADDLAATVDGLCSAFPDLRFVSEGEFVDGDTVVARWRMQGTNSGEPLPGAPAATNGTIDLPGVDVFTTRDGKVVDVVGYFDQKLFVEQLGLQAVVMPADEWPVSFGIATQVDLGNTTVPGAVSFTWIDTDDNDTAELQQRTTEIVTALASDPAFIGFRAMSIGGRNVTLTLWTSPEGAEAALGRNVPHNAAMDRLWQDGFGARGFTSIWQPFRVNNQFAKCAACARYVAIAPGEQSAACECGGTVDVTTYL